jgi:hypothetical protein
VEATASFCKVQAAQDQDVSLVFWVESCVPDLAAPHITQLGADASFTKVQAVQDHDSGMWTDGEESTSMSCSSIEASVQGKQQSPQAEQHSQLKVTLSA